MRHEQYATIGSGGVLPEFRGTRTIYNMAVEVLSGAKRDGVDIVLGQTTLGPKFERFLRIGGFKLGFWFAQQGSVIVFVILIFVYVWLMNRLDKDYDVAEE